MLAARCGPRVYTRARNSSSSITSTHVRTEESIVALYNHQASWLVGVFVFLSLCDCIKHTYKQTNIQNKKTNRLQIHNCGFHQESRVRVWSSDLLLVLFVFCFCGLATNEIILGQTWASIFPGYFIVTRQWRWLLTTSWGNGADSSQNTDQWTQRPDELSDAPSV